MGQWTQFRHRFVLLTAAVVPSANDILAELPKSIYGGFDSLALSNGASPWARGTGVLKGRD